MERHKSHGKIDTDKRHENGNERAQHTFNGRSRNNLKRTEEAERRTRNKGQARISVFGATGKPTFQNVMPEPPFARTSAHVYNTVRGKRRKRERLPTTCRTRKRGYDDKRIYARNGRIQKKRSGEIFAFSYVLNTPKSAKNNRVKNRV